MLSLLSKRPYRETKRSNSIGSLLRSYNYALLQKDETEAHRIIGELRGRKFLDAENQIYLNIEAAAHFSKWDTIYNHPQFQYILSARRPRKITSYLIQAAFQIEVAPLLHKSNIETVLNHFSTELIPKILPLFLDGVVDNNSRVLKMWMLKVVIEEKLDNVCYNLLIEEANRIRLDDEEWKVLVALKELKFTPLVYDTQISQELMIQAIRKGDLLKAKELGKGAPVSLAKAQMLIQCAVQHRDLDAFNSYLAVKQALPKRDVFFLDQIFERSFDSNLQSEGLFNSEIPIPDNWIDLIERMNEDEDFARNKASGIILDSSFFKTSKSGAKLLNLDRLNEALGRYRSQVSQIALKNMLPHLIIFLNEIEFEEGSKVPVYNTLLDLLLTTDELRKSDLQTINELMDSVLKSSISNERYAEVLMAITDLRDYYNTVHTVDCLMEFIEVVIQYRLQDKGNLQIVIGILKDIIIQQSKLKPHDDLKRLYNTICSFLDLDNFSFEIKNEQTVEHANPWQFYEGKSIGIYTLTESAAQRAEVFLSGLNLQIRTYKSHDHVGSDLLKDLAIRSDFLVIAANSAKHAATEFIKQHRVKKPILYALGKGTSSILAALQDYATSN